MRESLRIAGAYIGVVVGAGFASGQEVLQFFTSFSWYGFLGVVVAMVLFMFLGAQILQIGSQLQTQSHEQFFYHLYGKDREPIRFIKIPLAILYYGLPCTELSISLLCFSCLELRR